MSEHIEQIYQELKKLGLTDSLADFSIRWLGKSSRYVPMLRSSGREPSLDALGRLAAHLKYSHEYHKSHRQGELRLKADGIYILVRRCWTEFYETAMKR